MEQTFFFFFLVNLKNIKKKKRRHICNMKNQQIIRMRLRSSFYHVHSLKFWWVGTSTGGCEWCMVVVIPHILWWGGWKVKCSACFSLFLISYNLHIVIKNFNIKQNKKMLLYCEKALIFQPHNVWYCTYSSYGFWRRFRNINDSIGSILRDIESTEKKKAFFTIWWYLNIIHFCGELNYLLSQL